MRNEVFLLNLILFQGYSKFRGLAGQMILRGRWSKWMPMAQGRGSKCWALTEALHTRVQGARLMILLQEEGIQKASCFTKMCQ